MEGNRLRGRYHETIIGIWRCPKTTVPPNDPEVDKFTIETFGFGGWVFEKIHIVLYIDIIKQYDIQTDRWGPGKRICGI